MGTSKLKPYKKDHDTSYVGSTYAVMELLLAKPEITETVYIHSAFIDNCGLVNLCKERDILIVYSDKVFNLINQKENSYVAAVFRKYKSSLSTIHPHVTLVNPADMGNLGTIIRTAIGFNIKNLAIITPACDIYNLKTIRASMGAFFRINHEFFDDFEKYRRKYPHHQLFPFMLDGKATPDEIPPCLFSLIFGNEATGLGENFEKIGQPVKIPVSDEVDSYNLSIAAGIGMYAFAKTNQLI